MSLPHNLAEILPGNLDQRPAVRSDRRWLVRGSRLCIAGIALFLALSVLTGCEENKRQPPPRMAPEVEVSLPIVRQVSDYEDFTGQTAAVTMVDVRARVTGYLQKSHFKEGAQVKAGDLLFEIDPRQYKAAVDKAKAAVLQQKARLQRLAADYQRAMRLLSGRAITSEEVDKISADRMEAEATLQAAKADLELAELNLDFTKVEAPISGRIGNRVIHQGNLVKADDTALTAIVTINPIHVYFDVDERSLLKVRRLIREGKMDSAREKKVKVRMELSDEENFPHEGLIDFIDNRVDPGTGTLRVRGVFDNPKELLSPGLFVRVRVQIGRPHEAILVAEQTLGTDQGQKFVYVVNTDNKVEYRKVKVGGLHDGLREIEEGLSESERVVISGLQRVRPRGEVKPELVAMPTLAGLSPPAVVLTSTPDAKAKDEH